MFAREVNESQAIKDALEEVVLVQIDCEKGEGIELAKKYNVRGYPTYVAIDAAGEVTDCIIGYTDPESWASFAKFTTVDRRPMAAKFADWETKPSATLALSLGHFASTNYDFKGAVSYFKAGRDMVPPGEDVYDEPILTNMYYGSFSNEFTLDEVEAEVEPAFDAATDPADLLHLAGLITNVAKSSGKPQRAAPYLRKAMSASEGVTDEQVAGERGQLAIDAALIVEGDPEKAVTLMRDSQPEDWQDHPGGLNRFAWWCFENQVNLEEALELALKAVDLASDDESRAQILDTAAEICNALGDCSQAVVYMKQAVELEPNNVGHQRQLARFEKIVAEKDQG